MRNAILVMLLAVVSCGQLAGPPRWPKWVAVGESVDSWVYADINSIRKNGNMVKIWDLQDYKRVLLSITKPDDTPVSLDAPLASRERDMGVRAERRNAVT